MLRKMNTAVAGKNHAADNQISFRDIVGDRFGSFHAIGRQHGIAVIGKNVFGALLARLSSWSTTRMTLTSPQTGSRHNFIYFGAERVHRKRFG